MSKQATTEITIPESLNMDGLELRGNYRIIGYRQDILHALERKHVAAYVVTALLRWTKSKRDDLIKTIKRRAENKLPPLTDEELEIWIHMSYEEFADEFDGLFSHNTIKEAVSYLIGKGVILQRKNPNPKFKDYEYRLMLPILRKLLRSLPVNPVVRPRDNRNRKGKQSPNLVTPPEMVTSPNQANESPNLVDEPPELVDESPNLANQYTMSTQRQTKPDRKNDAPVCEVNATIQQASSHSFIPSQEKSSLSAESDQQTKPEAKPDVVFSPEAEQVYQLATDLNIICLKRNEEHRDNCMHLASKGVTTPEKMESLMQHCWQKSYLKDKDLNLKNLINELPGWLQLQRRTSAAPSTDVVTSAMGKATVGLLETEEKHKQKILEQEATQGKPKKTPSERYAELLASKKATVGTNNR